ncbi:hypothetical protein CA850_00760 [Micromonospora echinospora]|uniref:LamG-like jellyroll fold domain-containing protein n=1 Tax=Micromonospora echinospora TaxID=1877 RepID=UPI000B5AF2EC|nr:LamG-like jellyroll fold domain-containing protein [Micromonospora echinospora]OZV84425.1 hypothetical protein CA850_00760 [Micromonospora echinospora]
MTHQGSSGFPLTWFWNLLSLRPSWAEPPTPKQQTGRSPDRGHYVESPTFKDPGTSATARNELKLHKSYRPTAGKATTGSVRGFERATSRRLPEAATDKSDMFQNADGSYTRRVYHEPINFKDELGRWQPIDNTLYQADERLRVKSNPAEVTFASDAASAEDSLVRMNLGAGKVLGYGLAGASIGNPSLEGSTATYSRVFPDVDLTLRAQGGQVKESLVFHSPNVATEYLYPLQLTGLTAQVDEDGVVVFLDRKGAVAARMPVGWMEDAAVDRTGAGAISYGVRYDIVPGADGPALKVSIDGDWLRDPARKFPVVLDPTATQYTTNGDTYVQSGTTEPVRSSETSVAVGTFDGGTGKAKGLLPFPTFGSTFAGKKLSAADLNLFLTYQGVGTDCHARRFDVHRVEENWWASSVTYGTFPSYSASIGNASPNSATACGNTAAVRNVGSWVSVPMDVNEINKWVTGGSTYGLALTASETDSTAWKRFTSTDAGVNCSNSVYGTVSCAPFIDITYTDNVAPQVDLRYPSNNVAVDTLTPELLAQGHDPDSWPNKGLRYNFTISTDQGTPITSSGWVDSGVWKVPAGVLAWKKTYLYSVQVNDHSSTGPTTPTYAFNTQVPQPTVTSSLAQNGGKGYDPSVGNYTTSDTDAQIATAGPALTISRDYNSLDTRVDSAFGRGWSSVLDMQVREVRDAAGNLQTAAVRYPDGQEAAFGRNNDGTWVAPLGRYSVFKAITGGYSQTDKDSTTYEFTQSAGNGVYRITKITDSSGRALTFRYDTNGRVDLLTSVSSGRTLGVTWSTPPNSDHPHVVTVTTNPVVTGSPATAQTWTYTYDDDLLETVCEPDAGTQCASYDYTWVSQHANTVLNTGPYSFWRLNEAPGATTAASAVLSHDGTDNGAYTDVTLGGAPALAESTSTSASFNGTSSRVTLPAKAVNGSSYQSISMWFKTSTPNGVLFSYQKDAVTPGATTGVGYVPALYVGSDGKLRGQFWTGNPATAMSSPGVVTDDQWHHVALVGNGGSQQLYLDGAQVASLTGTISQHTLGATNVYLGAGFLGGTWPSQPHTTATATFFTGSIADVAYHDKAITAADVAAMRGSGMAGTAQLYRETSASGRVQAQVVYHSVTGRVSQVTDENGGVWEVGTPTVSGSSAVYVSAVLGSQPTDYWRLGDVEAPADAVNVVYSPHRARYNAVTFDTTQPNGTSPFADTYGAGFNGTSSYIKPYTPYNTVFPGVDYPVDTPTTVEMWFKTPANHATSGVLYSYQRNELHSTPATANWTPALYVGADGYLRGEFWTGSINPITSKTKVNDGNWHHVVLSASSAHQILYLDNKIVGAAGPMVGTNALHSYVGAGTTRSWPSSSGDVSYFKGHIAEFAYYERDLSPLEVDMHFKASKSAFQTGPTATLTPVTTVTVTDPTDKTSKQTFDLVNGNRLLATTDVLGRTTTYGYDIGGFESIEFDPLGMKTVTARDVRGNVVRSTVCRDQEWCDSTYYKYWPDSTTVNLTPDPRNDQVIEVRDARSQSETDNNHLTKLAYDTAGNRQSVTSPPVVGYPAGRSTTMTYSTATTPAVGGGTVPAGLPLTTRSAGGAEQKTEYNSAGDVVRITDPAGLVTEFTYDGLGRTLTKTVKAEAPLGDLTTTYVYDADGQVVEQTDPPVLNQVTGAVHTARTTTTYDADGNVTYRKVEDLTGGDAPRDSTSDYDEHGRPIKTVDAVGDVTLYEYDAYGHTTKTVNCTSNPPAGDPCPSGDVLREVADVYDAAGQHLTTTVTGEDGTSTEVSSKAYYANGNLASETDAMNWVTEYEYDANDNVKKITRTDGVKRFVVEENSYDAIGNLAMQRADNGANWTVYEHDAAGRLVSTTVQPYDLERVTKYTYDADDRVRSTQQLVGQLQTPLQTVENTYDAMGRVTSESVSVRSAGLPIGWWRMDEPSASYEAYDSSPSQRNLYSWNGPIGRSGGAAVFNRAAVYETAQPALVTTQSYSVSAWVRLSDLNQHQTVVGQGGNNTGGFFLRYHQGANRWEFLTTASDSATAAGYAARSTSAPTLNTWAHLVGVFDSGTKQMKLYVNGAQNGTATNPTPWNAPLPLSVGGILIGPNQSNMLNGSIDNVQVFQEALTAFDVSALYGGGNGRTATTTVTPEKLTTSYTVNQRGLVTELTDPMNNKTTFEYDAAGQLAKVVSPSISTETFGGGAPVPAVPVSRTGYNTFGEPTETQDPLTNTVVTRYDGVGRPIKTIMPDYTPPGGTPIVGAETSTVYDKLGQVVSTTDPLGKTTSFEYDSLGNRIKVVDAYGKATDFVYDKVGDLLERVDPTGAKTTATYDYLGRTLTTSQVVRQPTPATHTTTYDYGTGAYGTTPAAGPWLRKVTTPEGVVTSTAYNWVGEPITVTDGANNTTSTEYDGLGRAVKTTLPDLTKQTITYDGAGRTTKVQKLDAANVVQTTEEIGYDRNSNPIWVKDARQTTTNFTYDALGNLTNETQPVTPTSAIATSFGYDLAGNRTRFTDGRNNPFWTTYNSWGLPESRIEPATTAYPNLTDRTFTVAYDAAGRPVRQDSPGGVSVSTTYDDLGRVEQMSGSGAEVATVDRIFDYDDAGRLTSLSVPSGTNIISYDDRGLPLAITGPSDNSSFTYNRDGQLASRTDTAGTTSYTYDTVGRLKTVGNPTTGINVSVLYNKLSQPDTITHGTNNNFRKLTYDSLHRLKTDTLKNAAGTVTLGSITYGYDANGNETSKVTTGFAGSTSNTYVYDLADRLTSWTHGSTSTTYAYDDSGNRTQNGSKTFTYDARNQLLTQNNGTSYQYTPRGTLKQTLSGSVAYTTQTDAFGQVLSQQNIGGTTSTYSYDALGRAIKPGFTYTGIGNDLASDGTATYTRGPSGELLGVGTGSGAGSAYAWTDQHTDLVGLFSATGSALTGSTTYDPLGTVLNTSGMVGNLGYQSEWTDGLSDRVNMLTRWYNTDTGQFDTRDSADVNPVPDSIAANRFQYGDGNPLTTVDPTGHWGWSKFKSAVKSTVKAVSNPVSTFRAAKNTVSSTFKYVSSGRAWSDVKAGAKKFANKTAKAWNTVKKTTVKWAKKKINTVKDAAHSAKKCLSSGVGKCVKQTAKKAVKKAVDSAKSTVEAIKKDPWKFVATAAAALVATVAVGALCATGVGCLIVAGAVAGAMSAGTGYMVDVAQGEEKFSWSNLAGTMIEGGLDGALSGGLGRLGGGGLKYAGAAASRLPSLASRLSGAGKTAGGGAPVRAAGGGAAARSGGGSSGSGPAPEGRRSDAESGAGCGSVAGQRHSFDPSTRVLMADGSAKPIEDLQLGDEVAATDPVTGERAAKPVTFLHVNQDRDLTDVTVRDSGTGKSTVLKTTQHHPFWDATDRRWVDAGQLKPGHRLLVHDDKRLEGDGSGAGVGGGGPPGRQVTVVAVRNFAGDERMHDLTVADIHTYYVLAGKQPVLVHNCDPVFRGTTRGYEGSPGVQSAGVTPTSSDPGVATIFATHSEQYGSHSVVQIALPEDVAGFERYPGYIPREAEVQFDMLPAEFARRASMEIPASTARGILERMGINVPRTIHIDDLNPLLEFTPKLSRNQIAQFVEEARAYGR